MGPIVTEVEEVDELLAGLEASKLDDVAIRNWLIIVPLRIWHSDMSAIGQLENSLIAVVGDARTRLPGGVLL
jgi:hypothetical protein